MMYSSTLRTVIVFILCSLFSVSSIGQQHVVQARNGMTAAPANYKYFSAPAHAEEALARENNPGFEHHPETGMLFAEAPCDNCFELIGKRTENSKTFIRDGNNGRDILLQTSNASMHYRDAQGNWRTIITQLAPDNAHKGVYAATAQPVPVTINAEDKFSSLGKSDAYFRFNNGLELVYQKPDGTEQSLGAANWSNHTAGDDGMYVTNAWPGIDIELHTIRGAIKTNFIINAAMPAYAGGKLLVRDHLQMAAGLSLFAGGSDFYKGNLEIRNSAGEKIYAISEATAYEKSNVRNTLEMLRYHISGATLDIELPGDFLNRGASSYPVIIDPLVSIATSSVVNGSTYSPTFSTGCVYTNPATAPAAVSVTDVQFTFQYVTSGGAVLNNGAFDFYLGTCRSPTPTYIFWNCNSTLTGTCTGTLASIFPEISGCMPVPHCSPYNLNLTMDFYQDYAPDAACGTSYISAGSPLLITVTGHALEVSSISAFPSIVCQGQPVTLTAVSNYGVPPYSYSWSPGGYTGASVTVTPSGTTTYAVTVTDACGATSTASKTVSVNPVAAITGQSLLCVGGSSTLANTISGGTWASANTAVATINASGIVYGASAGTSAISYTNPAGCVSTLTVTVNPQVAPITGTLTVCQGYSTTLNDATTGGTWSSSALGIAAIAPGPGGSGIANGVSGGVSTITYATGGAGCYSVAQLTVNAVSATSGPNTVCYGGSVTFTNPVPGGTWSSSSTAIATVGLTSGIVTGASDGVATITYNTAGCSAVKNITVNPLTPITGTFALCQSSAIGLSDATTGGTWTSLNTAVAVVDPSTGMVTGISPGIATIRYITAGGCIATQDVTVNPLPGAITGATLVCNSINLSNSIAGGSWSSGNILIATVDPSTGTVTAVSAGSVSITYSMPGGCFTTVTLSVDPVSSITGPGSVCQGNSVTLSYPASGGTWSSGSSSIASVDAVTGSVSGLTAGSAMISYTTSAGCVATKTMAVNAMAPVSGSSTICQGNTITLSDAVAGGTWSSSSPATATVTLTTGTVSGIAPGTSTITYTTSAGCQSTKSVTVNPLAAVTGTAVICQGLMTTLSDAVAGGTWNSSNTFVAIVSPTSGMVTGQNPGTVSINYTTAEGCVASRIVTVNATPAPISGAPSVCQGFNATFTESLSGGAWSSSSPGIASVGAATGIVYGLLPGAATISYTTASGCFANTDVTVNPLAPVTGVASVCAGNTTILGDATPGGSWSSAGTTTASVDPSSGAVTGLTAGSVIIAFTTPAGCVATRLLTVYAVPAAIGGTSSVCVGNTTALTNTLAGGLWSSADATVATINASTGVASGVSANVTTITYTTTGGCFTTTPITVNPLPAAVTGVASVCVAGNITLSDATAGGTWSSLSTGIATTDAVTGVVSGVAAGTSIIHYTTPAGCFMSVPVTVNPLPAAITGITTVCEGATSPLNDVMGGGTWSSSNTTVAQVSILSGVMSGISTGTAIVTYTSGAGCITTTGVIVNPTPHITGTSSTGTTKCTTTDATITLSGLTPGETYTVQYSFAGAPVSITITADISGSVTITGLAPGAYTNLLVTTALGCSSNTIPGPVVLSVPPTPATPMATNNTPICAGSDIDLSASDVTSGVSYSWTGPAGFTSSSQNPVIANAVTGMSGTYSVTATRLECTSAIATTDVVVHPIPAIASVSGTNPETCQGSEGTLVLTGLLPGVSYTVYYVHDGAPGTQVVTAGTSGTVTVTGLSSGSYGNIYVTSFTCVSNTVGPVTLRDPNPPPAPILGSNSPICAGKTLQLSATDAISDVTYEWHGPGGFTSDLQYPQVPDILLSDSGTYTLTVWYRNCPTTASEFVTIHPPVSLTDVTPSQMIALGSSLQLNANGAEFYLWSPNDGSLSDPNSRNPVATPEDTVTYTVEGVNRWGCKDFAYVALSIDYSVNEFIPTGFTPNGDGRNDVFRIGNLKYDKLIDFSVFNRWGQLVYHNTYDPKEGWDGTFNGVAQPMGTYFYSIVLGTPNGKTKNFKGEVTLIR